MKNDVIVIFLAALLTVPGLWPTAEAGAKDKLWLGGYVQGGLVCLSAEMPEPYGGKTWGEYRLQKRLNLRWDLNHDLSFHWQMRTRVFAGNLVRNFPQYVEALTRDEGLLDLSWKLIEEDDWLLHYIPDRLYVERDWGDWNVRVGRQRVNWGVNLITNPNDIFNIYSVYDFDYPERPGADALRLQRFLGLNSRFEVAASPARKLKNSVAALLYTFNRRGYDVQLIGGYYRERLAAGAGWAGNLGGASLKGETMFFSDIEKKKGSRQANVIIAASIDYMFANSLFMVLEMLYNDQGGRDEFQPLATGISADNPSFSRYQVAARLAYPLHPLLDGAITTIYYPDERAIFVSPSLTWSVIQNLDMVALGQVFVTGKDSVFEAAGNLITLTLKYSF